MTTANELESASRIANSTIKQIKERGTCSREEIRFLVDAYYQVQKMRIALGNQIFALTESNEPHEISDWLFSQFKLIESQISRSLKAFCETTKPGQWLLSITGIGPVLAANFLAHLDVTKSETAGGFWRFAGLDPTLEWKKGCKRPFNARLKTACWKAGESFCKVQNRDSDVYGKVYAERKALEIQRNDRLEFADQAKEKLEKFNIGKDTDAYKHYAEGKLPPAHIDQRAKRYAVKLFLSHLHHVMYECEHGRKPPKPYVIEHMGHAHYVAPPNWPL